MEEAWITVATYRTPGDAALGQSVLDGAGIPFMTMNEVAMAWAFGETAGGIQIQVPREHAQEATELLWPKDEAAGEDESADA